MTEGIEQLRDEQRKIVGRVFRIIAIGTAVGAVFFLYTEFVMTMEQTRQWLLSDVPRDEKVARAMGEQLTDGSCDDLTADLQSVRAERDAAVESCHSERAALVSSAASSEEAFRASLKSLETETATQRSALAQRDAEIAALRKELAATKEQIASREEVEEPEEDDDAILPLMKRWNSVRSSKRKIKVTAARAYYDEDIGLSVSLREFSGDYSVEMRITAPTLGTVTGEMAPGEQRSFQYEGVRYTLVLLETDPEKGNAEFSLVGKPLH